MIAVWAVCLDMLLGDPRSSWHPVVLMGKLISWWERRLYPQGGGIPFQAFCLGAILVLGVSGCVYGVTWGALWLADKFLPAWGQMIFQAILLSFMISPRSLAGAGYEILQSLKKGDLPDARKKVGWIVGRDTEHLSVEEIVRAVVETIAENTVDGILSPIFFFWLGGLPLAVFYRAANTMDSMIGYKNERYLYFGRAAARLDDILNYFPARLAGILFLLAAVLWRMDAKNAGKILWRDAKKHPSPNGGWPESAAAGALRVRLGGFNSYFGKTSFRAYMGKPIELLCPGKIRGIIHLMYTVTWIFLAGGLGLQWTGGILCGSFLLHCSF